MGRSRDWRRAQRARVIARTEDWMRSHGWFRDPYSRWSAEEAREAVRKNAVTPHPCSRHCCGNPRRWFDGNERLTRQELKAGLDEKASYHDQDSEPHPSDC